MADNHGDFPDGYEENKQMNIALARSVVSTLGSKQGLSADQARTIALALAYSFMTREKFVENVWGSVEAPPPENLREWTVGERWITEGATSSFVAIEVGMRDNAPFSLRHSGVDAYRIFSLYEITCHLAESFLAAAHGQTVAQAITAAAGLAMLFKRVRKDLTPAQVAIMGVAHQINGKEQSWSDWENEVNDKLNGWKANANPRVNPISAQELRDEVKALKDAGFTILDTPTALRIPRTMVVIPAEYLPTLVLNAL